MIKKKVSPQGKSVRVTFALPAETVENTAAVVGTFNEWDVEEGTMKFDAKKGIWTKSISFKPGETVEFRYFVDEGQWLNDEEADETAATPYFSENSVLEL
ncbi:MAG TPA: isoamylase early set domain-containing protein [Rhodothermales bacterium]|nr:isoamylase early set domain-containing protein [Rhodothermales bacterium]